jgi:hypothetical protein
MSPWLLPLVGVAASGGKPPSTALPEQASILDILEFQGVGLVIVMGALLMMYLLCAAIGLVFQRLERARKPRMAPLGVVSPGGFGTAQASPDIPLVVIAAAVAAVEVMPHRIVEVKPASAGWTLEGRRQLLASHLLRR